jgi:DNA-binding protein Fis
MKSHIPIHSLAGVPEHQGQPETPPEDERFTVVRLIRSLLVAGEPELYRKVGLAVDRVLLGEVLRHVQGNQVRASKLLGISRTTRRAKLRAVGLAGDPA